MQINYRNLQLARESRGLTQQELSNAISGLNQGNLSKMEKGLSPIPEAVLESIARTLDYPLSFFEKESQPRELTTAFYRKYTSTPQKQLNVLECRTDIIRRALDELTDAIDIPTFDIPQIALGDGLTPTEIAKRIRVFCGIPKGPVDEIVKLMETGPLPKMVACSHDGRHVAITHWGNNTVGLVNVSSLNPDEWYHEKLLVVDYVLPLDYSLTEQVDRDNKSGYCLRGTVFTPDDRYLLVGCMGDNGGIAIIDMETQRYLGRVLGMMPNVRHLVIRDGFLYLSINKAGYVQRIKLDTFMNAATKINGKTTTLKGWESCKVGDGARTIELSPSGHFVFAACNLASRLDVVDTRTMKKVASIDVDSYPVGLDISNDGRFVIVTSQGRGNSGTSGNAVNIYEVEYAEPEPVLKHTDGAAVLELLNEGDDGQKPMASVDEKEENVGKSLLQKADGFMNYVWLGGGAAIVLLALLAHALFARKRMDKS